MKLKVIDVNFTLSYYFTNWEVYTNHGQRGVIVSVMQEPKAAYLSR